MGVAIQMELGILGLSSLAVLMGGCKWAEDPISDPSLNATCLI